MNPKDIPPTAFVHSALEALSKAEIEATVIYTVEKNGKRITRADSNKGPVGMARQLAAVRIGEGAIERAAIALHEFRLKLPDSLDDDSKAAMNICPVCGTADSWDETSEPDRHGHREIVKIVLGHAMASPPAAAPPLVTV